MRNLLNNVEIQRVINRNAGASGGTVKGTIIDMQGFRTATFVVLFDNVLDTADVDIQVAQGDVNDTAQMTVSEAAVTRVATATSMDNKAIVIEVVEPLHRYLELQVAIATANAPLDGAVVIKSNAARVPTTQGSTVVDAETFVSPEAA